MENPTTWIDVVYFGLGGVFFLGFMWLMVGGGPLIVIKRKDKK